MNGGITIFGASILVLLLAGYLGQKFLPPPKPKIVGIDLGTTYSCIGVYHAVTGAVSVLPNKEGKKCIPSVVAFQNDAILVGYKATAQADHNPNNTIYDTKRFIGKIFKPHELRKESHRYPFDVKLDKYSMAQILVGRKNNVSVVSPEYIGSQILRTLRETAEANLSVPVTRAVMSVPAEFNELQRNYTKQAAKLAGIDVFRIINEPTAAALAYGLHKKQGVRNVMVVDLGGGTLDVSLLNIQGGMFFTQGMAGNNHLGGQDFNQNLLKHLLHHIQDKFGENLIDAEDIQTLRDQVELVKLRLTSHHSAEISIKLQSFKSQDNSVPVFHKTITRTEFEDLNSGLFKKVLEPIEHILQDIDMVPSDVNEVVLVGGSTRIPKVRQLIAEFFNKEPNVSIDPELAVTFGVSIQAGILGGMWPLTVSAIELPTDVKKIYLQ